MRSGVTATAEPRQDGGVTLGQLLRERREARGLSQEEAAQKARVQLVFVRTLEGDDYRLLPDERYLGRFVYEYALFLGLDPAAAEAAFRRQIRREPGHVPLYQPTPLLAALPWRRLLWATSVILPLIPLGFIVVSLVGREPGPVPRPPDVGEGLEVPPPTAERRASTPERVDALLGSDPVAPPRAPAPAPPASVVAGQSPPPPHLLVARANEVTWMAVRVDGGEERQVLLREGETVRWEADRGFLLTVGNAGGVELTLDGRPVRLPGGRGDVVRELRLPPPPPPPQRPGQEKGLSPRPGRR